MPRIPGLTELLSLLQTQTEALAQLPRTLSDLNGTVRELTRATTMAATRSRPRSGSPSDSRISSTSSRNRCAR